MARQRQLDLKKVRTISISSRDSKVALADFAKVFNPRKEKFSKFIDSLPKILVAKDLVAFAGEVARAHKKRKPVIVLMGAHVVKVGLGPLLIDLLKSGVITAIGMNSAAAIHDVETAIHGTTSEDVERYLADGRFGMVRETGEFINGALNRSFARGDEGYGESLGKALSGAKNKSLSILATCYALGVPATVHAAIGTDIIHQQPSMNGAATGELSFRDFKVLCNSVKDLRGPSLANREEALEKLIAANKKERTVAVSVKIPEQHFGARAADPAAETELKHILQETGFTIVDDKSDKKADIEISGEAFSALGLRKGNLISCKSRIELTARKRADGSILHTDRQTSVAVDITEQTAGKTALENAARELAGRLLAKL